MTSRSHLRALQIGMSATPERAGGLDRYYFSLLQALPEAGIDVAGLVVGDAADVAQARCAVDSFAPEGASVLRRWRGLRANVPKHVAHSDLVVSHFAPYAFPVLDSLAARPFVNHFHGPWALEALSEGEHPLKAQARRLVERAVYARAARFIVLSQSFANVLIAEYGVAPQKIRIVPGGVDVRHFNTFGSRTDARARLGWPANRPIVATVRRLVRSKGLENLVAATNAIVQSVPNAFVAIVGLGPLAERLQRMIVERGLEGSVRLVGHVSEDLLPSVYRASDLLVVPTTALEGFGLVVIESLACGTPVLVTPVGGLPEVVRALDPALILAGSTASDLAAGITRALNGKQILPGREACSAYAQRFDWPRIAAQVSDVYRELSAP